MAIQEELQAAIRAVLPDVSCVIGWAGSPGGLQGAPLFMRDADDVAGFSAGFFAVNNPALYLPEYKGTKVGVVVKGCDSRSVGQLLAEGLVRREDLVIIGYGCTGVIDQAKAAALLREQGLEPAHVRGAREEGEELVLCLPDKELRVKKQDLVAEKCRRCLFPNSLIADVFVGPEQAPAAEHDDFADLAAFERLSLEERMAFWEKEMSRCTRCYACRNACPLCVCRDHCAASSREPAWITQADGVRDKLFFQIIHAMHLAGRCTGCGECQRACPVGIPVLLLKRAMGRRVGELFAYKSGIDLEGAPPLLTFRTEESRITEREW